MGNNFSLARSEKDRRGMLLASSSSRQVRYYAPYRDPRAEENQTVQAEETPETINPKKKSKSTPKVKSGDGRRRKERRQHNTPRKSAREVEGGNITTGRTAKELGIVWPDDRCADSPITKAHHFVAVSYIADGDIFECKYCHRVKWLSRNSKHAIKFGVWIRIYGEDRAYQMMLDRRPTAKNLMAKIQDFYLLRKSVPEESLAKVIAAVMSDNDYPYDVKVVEEEVL